MTRVGRLAQGFNDRNARDPDLTRSCNCVEIFPKGSTDRRTWCFHGAPIVVPVEVVRHGVTNEPIDTSNCCDVEKLCKSRAFFF